MNRTLAFGLGVVVAGLSLVAFTAGLGRFPGLDAVSAEKSAMPSGHEDMRQIMAGTPMPSSEVEMNKMMEEMMGTSAQDDCAQMMAAQAGARP